MVVILVSVVNAAIVNNPRILSLDPPLILSNYGPRCVFVGGLVLGSKDHPWLREIMITHAIGSIGIGKGFHPRTLQVMGSLPCPRHSELVRGDLEMMVSEDLVGISEQI